MARKKHNIDFEKMTIKQGLKVIFDAIVDMRIELKAEIKKSCTQFGQGHIKRITRLEKVGV